MKLYRTTHLIDPENSEMRSKGMFAASKDGAAKQRAQLRKLNFHCEPKTEELLLDTKRDALIVFLNELAS